MESGALAVAFLFSASVGGPGADRRPDLEVRQMPRADYRFPFDQPADDAPGPAGRLSLLALPGGVAPTYQGYRGMRLQVVNKSEKPAGVLGQDGRVFDLRLEAVDPFGQWRPVEEDYMGGWCGTGVAMHRLGPGRAWELAAPRYAGSFPTRLRFALLVFEGPQKGVVVSNEFDGWVNPDQFAPPPRE